MAIYQRGKNWYIDFTFKGHRVRESIGPSKKNAQKVIDKRKTEIVENKYLDIRKDPDPVKFHDFAKDYLQWSKANKKPSTYVGDVSILRILDAEFESKTIQEITTWQIEKYKASRKEKVNIATVNREMNVLKHLFNKAVEWGKLKESPAKRVKLFKGVTHRIRFLMPDEVSNLLSNCEGIIKDITTVAVHTGMRRGEMLSLKKENVDLERSTVSAMDTKNHERRDIPINKTVTTLLTVLTEGKQGDEYVFLTSKGKPLLRSTLYRGFQEAVKKSGITNFWFHDLRHYAEFRTMPSNDSNS